MNSGDIHGPQESDEDVESNQDSENDEGGEDNEENENEDNQDDEGNEDNEDNEDDQEDEEDGEKKPSENALKRKRRQMNRMRKAEEAAKKKEKSLPRGTIKPWKCVWLLSSIMYMHVTFAGIRQTFLFSATLMLSEDGRVEHSKKKKKRLFSATDTMVDNLRKKIGGKS